MHTVKQWSVVHSEAFEYVLDGVAVQLAPSERARSVIEEGSNSQHYPDE